MIQFRLLGLTIALLLLGGTQPAVANTAPVAMSLSPVKPEHEAAVPYHVVRTSQIPALRSEVTTTVRARMQAAGTGDPSIQFLTRPYTTWHVITSVFDHCNPDYTQDGRVCRFDGSVGLKSNGVDPSFALGYAQTPGGSDYLYYDGHNGWDYGLNYENVLAAADGTVRLAGTDSVNPCFGQTIIVDHPNGFSTRYAHLSAIYVSPGQSVDRGQVIAQSGNTGCSSGPHLHFGVYITSSWTAIDPWGWWGAPAAEPWPSDPGDLWLTGTAQFPLPFAPTNVGAIAGNASATISWTPPSFNGGTGITSYTITASPGGAVASAPGTATSAVVGGLTNGTSYTFTVTALNTVGASQSASSNAITPSAWMGRYRTLPPARILDTRNGTGGFGPLGTARSIDLPVVGRGGLPTSGVAAVVLNVTATNASAASYLSVYPTGTNRPATSDLNFTAGQTVPNLVEVGVGAGGDVSLYNNVGSVDVIVDIVGWVSSDTTSSQGQFVSVAPTRLLDTRVGLGSPSARLGQNQVLDVQVGGQGGVPASGAGAVVLNLTVTNPSTAGYVSAYASGTARPPTSNVNYVAGQTVANRAIVAVGAAGKVSLYNCCGSTDLLVDVAGWFSDGTNASQVGGQYTGLPPVRVVDTRNGLGGVQGPVGAGTTAFTVAGVGGVPAMTDPMPPRAVIVNVTITDATAAGHRTVYPDGTPRPSTSDLNLVPGATVANLVVTPVSSDGKIAVYSFAGFSDVIIDVLGFYS